MLVLLGIMQMGLILNGFVTISNASREGARAATVYLYDRNKTKAENDAAREAAARSALDASMGLLSKTAPQLATSDVVISYPCDAASPPSGCGPANDPRTGQYIKVRMTYHMDLFLPLVSNVMPHDSGGRLPMTTEATMVIN